jgi:uncharacterized protein YndB with AHSA1/START domain
MANTNTQSPMKLVVRRTLPAKRERVFAAWTQADQMRKWAGPGEVKAAEVECDLRVGGKYRIGMLRPDGETWYVGGIYREIREPERISYTWRWEEENPADEFDTLVTVEFHERGEQTELVLTHEGFANEESRSGHEGGWGQAIDKLATLVS